MWPIALIDGFRSETLPPAEYQAVLAIASAPVTDTAGEERLRTGFWARTE